MKILNLYCGIGGNRELWDSTHNITAVEIDEKIAEKYAVRFPKDKVVVGDAHEYLLDHYKEFDFIWTSPPCQTHSRTNYFTQSIRKRAKYPDMKLYQEIIFLSNFFKGLFCVENVKSYYKPMIEPTEIGRHFILTNFKVPKIPQAKNDVGTMMKKYVGTGKHAHDKSLEDRNAVNSELGLHILNCALGKNNKKEFEQVGLFKDEW